MRGKQPFFSDNPLKNKFHYNCAFNKETDRYTHLFSKTHTVHVHCQIILGVVLSPGRVLRQHGHSLAKWHIENLHQVVQNVHHGAAAASNGVRPHQGHGPTTSRYLH